MFTRELIQAVNDWQRGGSPKQKAARALRLKKEAAALPGQFRQCALCCFRQITLEKGGGYSSDRDKLVRMMYGPNPSQADYADFDRRAAMAGAKLGADWIGEYAKDRVIAKIRGVMPCLRTIKMLQNAMAAEQPQRG